MTLLPPQADQHTDDDRHCRHDARWGRLEMQALAFRSNLTLAWLLLRGGGELPDGGGSDDSGYATKRAFLSACRDAGDVLRSLPRLCRQGKRGGSRNSSTGVPLLSVGSGTAVAAALLMAQVRGVVTCALLMTQSLLHLPPTHPPPSTTHSLSVLSTAQVDLLSGRDDRALAALNEVRGEQCAPSGYVWVYALRWLCETGCPLKQSYFLF